MSADATCLLVPENTLADGDEDELMQALRGDGDWPLEFDAPDGCAITFIKLLDQVMEASRVDPKSLPYQQAQAHCDANEFQIIPITGELAQRYRTTLLSPDWSFGPWLEETASMRDIDPSECTEELGYVTQVLENCLKTAAENPDKVVVIAITC